MRGQQAFQDIFQNHGNEIFPARLLPSCAKQAKEVGFAVEGKANPVDRVLRAADRIG
jgi:hypothetical protein